MKHLTQINYLSSKYKFFYLSITVLFTAIAINYLLSSSLGLKSIALVGAPIGILLFVSTLRNIKFGFYISFISYFMLDFLIRALKIKFTIGVFIEAYTGLLVLALIYRLWVEKNRKFATSGITILLALWFVYLSLQIFNPHMLSKAAYIHSMRTPLYIFCTYLIAYHSLNNLKDLWFMVKVILIMMSIACLYGIFQEKYGLLSFDSDWLYSDPERVKLMITWGRLRKFSIFSGPMPFGVTLAFTGIFSVILALESKKKRHIILYSLYTLIALWASVYTGTRTAYILIPFGYIIYLILRLNPRLVMFSIGLVSLLTVAVAFNHSSGAMHVVRTAFTPNDDPSMQVRLDNQAFIQPILQSRPFGSGLGRCGHLGAMYSPNTKLGKFPPDSEYVRIAIESGPIGLFLYMCINGAILIYGLYYAKMLNNPQLKTIIGAFSVMFFMIILGGYPQEIISGSKPLPLFYAFTVAAIAKIPKLDK
ncbi:O-antigen ligase family protein [Limibacter armeniacum]|uniref:O-antigen ligase family protein n=1 Tax=Limibacter armeniacum TaxID=466084 RepID=UPI002FE649A9